MLMLIVKGNCEQAVQAAQNRDVAVCDSKLDSNGNSRLLCPTQALNNVVRWFCEPDCAPESMGFPVGSCLFYREGVNKL